MPISGCSEKGLSMTCEKRALFNFHCFFYVEIKWHGLSIALTFSVIAEVLYTFISLLIKQKNYPGIKKYD